MALTDKQEAFCRFVVETQNQSEAYRRAFDTSKMKDITVVKRASELANRSDIKGRLAELRKANQQRHEITVDSLVEELEEARRVARDEGQASAMVASTMGKAKLMGLDKQLVEHSGGISYTIVTGVPDAE